MAANWYTLHSHPRKEESLWNQVLNQGFEAFYPHLRVKSTNPTAKLNRAYFPGYLFVKADLGISGISTFQWMPFSTGLVSFGGEPAVVPDSLILAIQQRMQAIADAGGEKLVDIHSGDTVNIEAGPFAGYEAIFDARLPGTERVRVLLKMLNQRSLPVELEARAIKSTKNPKPQR